MNIVWIEDFGDQPNPIQFASLLFKCLSESARAPSLFEWMTVNDEVQLTQQALDKYCSQNISEHQIILLGNLRSYLDWCAHVDVNRDADIFILDINLTTNDRPELPMSIPAGFEVNTDFHKKAGLYIYNDLLARRFPKDKICLMTGENTTLIDFEETCAKAFMEPPKNFHKSEWKNRPGPAEFHKWLLNFAHNDLYLRFRRGALDGITWALGDIKQRKTDALHFRNYILPRDQRDHFNEIEAQAYLAGLAALLSPDATADTLTVLRLFLRALVHEWESRTEATAMRPRHASVAAAQVLKLARNCLTHGRLIDEVSAHDLAILFVLNFRAMFGAQIGASRGYERSLYRMFNAPSVTNIKASDAILERENNLRGYLDRIVSENKHKRVVDGQPLRSLSDKDGTQRKFKINEVANELSLAIPPDLGLPFPALVIGTFWLSLHEATASTFFLEDTNLSWVADLHQHAFLRYFDEAVK